MQLQPACGIWYYSASPGIDPPVNQDPAATEFNICPNAGIRRPGWPWLMAGLVVVGLGIAVRLALLGFWLVLPFTIVELGMVYYLVDLVRRRGSYIEKIRIDGEKVSVSRLEHGKDRDRASRFPLYWVRVDLRPPTHRWYPHRLLLGASGRWVEVGSCLTDPERHSLADAVRQEIRRFRTPARPENA